MDIDQPSAYTPAPEQMQLQPATMGMQQPMMVQPRSGYQPVAAQTSTASVTVMQPGPATHVYIDSKPDNYLVLSVLTMIFCCFICGLIALNYSLQVDSDWNNGDQEGAKRSARMAKNWSIASLVSCTTCVAVTIVGGVIGVAVTVTLAGAAAATTNPGPCYDHNGYYIC